MKLSVVVPALLLVAFSWPADARRMNDFEVDDASIPVREIKRGGPPRDGIPAIFRPKFIKAGVDDFVEDGDRVLGVNHGTPKAFPVSILNYHEVVNDWTMKGRRMVVTYCPLCGSGMAFVVADDDRARSFGVSGLLYNSDVLLYDHQTESLWSQILAEAVTGSSKGERLEQIPVMHETWGQWRKRYPDTYVLSTDTGYTGNDYRRTPYRGYDKTSRLMFPVAHKDRRFHAKAWVLGLEIEGVYKAYPFEELAKLPGPLTDDIGGRAISVHYINDSDDSDNQADATAWAEDDQGRLLAGLRLFWFAWYGFHPETEVFTAPELLQ